MTARGASSSTTRPRSPSPWRAARLGTGHSSGAVADAVGQELRAQGANLFGGPCINLLRHPGWGRAQETFGEDPYLLGEMAAATIEGVQRHNVMACAKHFALNSIDEPRNVIDVRADERTLREVYLPHFKRAVDAGVAAIMSSYNKVNGDYAAENEWLLRTVLKKEWGFRGVVLSDFVRGVYDGPKAARAGLDIEMPLAHQYGPAFLEDVRTGAVSRDLVDEAVRRVLRRKISYLTRRDPQAYDASLVVSPGPRGPGPRGGREEHGAPQERRRPAPPGQGLPPHARRARAVAPRPTTWATTAAAGSTRPGS